jgi:hypothetical protein
LPRRPTPYPFLDDEKVAVKPADGALGSGFTVALEAPCTFKYYDSRSAPEEADTFDSGLLLDFGPDGIEGLSFVAFAELKS